MRGRRVRLGTRTLQFKSCRRFDLNRRKQRERRSGVCCVIAAIWLCAACVVNAGEFFREGFEDSKLLERGWYDGSKFLISDGAKVGKGCIEFAWKEKTTTPESSTGIRRLFEPSESVYLSFYIRLSKGWGWTGRDYHPHLLHFMTTENGKFDGP